MERDLLGTRGLGGDGCTFEVGTGDKLTSELYLFLVLRNLFLSVAKFHSPIPLSLITAFKIVLVHS